MINWKDGSITYPSKRGMRTMYCFQLVRADVERLLPVPHKPRRRRKPATHPGGRPPEYDTDGSITAAVMAVAKHGVDDKLSTFIERVYLELQDRKIKQPGLTWMKENVGPIHERLKRKSR
jgi:hypothetical protein